MVDMKRLDAALQGLADSVQKLYFWSEKMDDGASQLSIDYRGHLIDVPLSVLDLERLVEVNKAEAQSACIVKKEEFNLKLKTNMSLKELFDGLASLVLAKMFGVSLENLSTSVEVRPECLVICRDGDSFRSSFNYEKEPGTFGCMFLQLPVDGEDSGCHLRIQNKKEMYSFEFKEDSSSSLYLGAIAGPRSPSGKQDYTLTTSNNGPAAMVVCNLVWMDSFALTGSVPVDQFPDYVLSLHEINQSLLAWKFAEPSDDDRFLALPLHRNYSRTEFSLNGLKDVDRQLAHTLMSIDYLDVDLAILEEERLDSENDDTSFDGIEKMYHWREKAISDSKIKLHKWSVSDASFLTDCLAIDASNHVTGSFNAHITGFECCQKADEKPSEFVFRPAIVIQPKYRRFANLNPRSIALAKYFESRLPEVLTRMSHGNHSARNLLLSDLNQAIAYLRISDKSWQFNYNLFKMLNVCARVKAADEGLQLLDIVTRQQLICEEEDHVYSEVYLPQFTDCLADFVCLVTGWERTSDLILRLATADSRSYTIPCDLGIKLYDRDCLSGAVQIADTILSVIHSLSPVEFASLQDTFSWDLVDLVMYVDSDERTPRDPSRYEKLLAVLNRLPCDRLPYLMPHVDYSPKLVLDLGKIVVSSPFTSFEPWHFVSVIKVCEDLGAVELLVEFWTKTCTQEAEFVASDSQVRPKSLFEVLVLTDSLKVKQKHFLIKSMACYRGAKERINVSVNEFLMQVTQDVAGICSYFLFIALAENLANLSNEGRVRRFCNVYEALSTEKLCVLIASLRQLDCTEIKDQLASRFMFKTLLEQVLTRDFATLMRLSSDSLIENFRFFSWFGHVGLIGLFMRKLIDMDMDMEHGADKWKTIIGFVNRIINDADVSIDVILSILLETWIVAIGHLKESAGFDYVGTSSSKCLENFIKAERNGIALDIDAKLEEMLLSLSPSAQIVVINDTFVKEVNVKENNMKTLAKSWNTFSQLSKSLASKALLKSVFFTLSTNQIVHLVQSFLWLGHELPIKQVTELICKIPVVGSPLSLVSKTIVSAGKTLHLAATSNYGVLAVNDLIDHCIERLHFKMQPKFSWAMDEVDLKQWPEIEQFMKSEAKRLRYGAFKEAAEAERFVDQLLLDPSWGVTSRVKLVKSTFRVELVKSYPFSIAGDYEKALVASVDELKAVRRRLLTSVMRSEKAAETADVAMQS